MNFVCGPLRVQYVEPEDGFRVQDEEGREWRAERVCFEGKVWLQMNEDGIPEITVNVGAEIEPVARP